MKQGNTTRYKLGLLILLGMLLQSCASPGPKVSDPAKAAQLNAQLGAQLLEQGKLEQARDTLEKALKLDNKNALAHLTYGQLQFVVEEPETANVHFKRAIALAPKQASHRNAYGAFLCQIKEYDAAIKQFVEAGNDKFWDTPWFAWDNAGVCMLDANQLDKADGYLRKALQLNPKFANSYLHMAELLYKRKRLTVADAYFQRFMSYGNDTAESLLLGIQINRDTGKEATAEQFANKLLNDFPTSREAGEYLSRPLQ